MNAKRGINAEYMGGAAKMESEAAMEQQLHELQKQLEKNQRFEEAVSSLNSLLRDRYLSASPPLRESFYAVVCRVATVLKTRYTAPGFWRAGLGLFEQAVVLVSDLSEKEHLKFCVAQAREQLEKVENSSANSQSGPSNSSRRGYFFEGHLTVDPDSPQPRWQAQRNVLRRAAAIFAAQSSHAPREEEGNLSENASHLLQELINNLDNAIPELMEDGPVALRVPPASKEVVAKLPIIALTTEIIAKLGQDVECAICRENLVVDDKMQELPCKHLFHPPCLKPWLDEHNSCPVCRHELKTDDHVYESWKEREREAEEDRKGAANALQGGEDMYG